MRSWAGGFVFSFLFIWAVSSIFVNSVAPVEYDSRLDKYVYREGAVTQWRSEGWADTGYGTHGLTLLGTEALMSSGPKVVLWGNSQVEALQVEDRNRTINLFSKMAKGEVKGIAVARGGNNCADVYFDIARYEGLIDEAVAHVVLLNNVKFLMPDRDFEGHSRFTYTPLSFVEEKVSVSPRAMKFWPVINKYKLDFLYHDIYSKLKGYSLFQKKINYEPKSDLTNKRADKDYEAIFGFVLRSMMSVAGGKLVFAYAPNLPYVRDGRVLADDPDSELIMKFREKCTEFGVGFVDARSWLEEVYSQQGVLPHGFFNSEQGDGHLNKYGHEAVAKALHDYFKGRIY